MEIKSPFIPKAEKGVGGAGDGGDGGDASGKSESGLVRLIKRRQDNKALGKTNNGEVGD